MDQAIESAKAHYRRNYSKGGVPQFRVYESSDPDGAAYALIEVSEGEPMDMRFVALYKVIAGKYRFDKRPGQPSLVEAGGDVPDDSISGSGSPREPLNAN
jgi:hypothetical protein